MAPIRGPEDLAVLRAPVIGDQHSPRHRPRTIAGHGGRDGTARLWRIADRHRPEPLAVLTGHRHNVNDVAFSPDGHRELGTTPPACGTCRMLLGAPATTAATRRSSAPTWSASSAPRDKPMLATRSPATSAWAVAAVGAADHDHSRCRLGDRVEHARQPAAVREDPLCDIRSTLTRASARKRAHDCRTRCSPSRTSRAPPRRPGPSGPSPARHPAVAG
ncbi:hypothetical protein [[Actinomadura] parvosata]|uniref:hypothetical protein n=1 Tax=[Actinomadura] parvosata TaxID=1955412 RepID=UPI003AABAC8C